ncbi:MAG: hypothetical protein QMD07_00990 [Thermodesulfovibrionales bacterium]|nr:hypothetical protein [Thermodesulfovibrionales bacterium]
MKKIVLSILFFASFIFLPGSPAQAMNGWWGGHPYGGYCPRPMGGWYGAKKSVNDIRDARKILNEYFKDLDVVIGDIKERKWFFEADIKDKNNNLIDVVIVDKRTGRIRSIY